MGHSIGRFVGGLALIIGVSAGTGLGAAFVAPGVAGADMTFNVNDVGDFNLADGAGTTCVSTHDVGESETPTCTLRAAIEAANNLEAPVTINLPDPTNSEVMLVTGPDYLIDNTGDAGFGQLSIDDVNAGVAQLVTITGVDQSIVTIQGAESPTTRILKVEPEASADISGVTIQGGDASNPGEVGGAILNCFDLTLSNSTVTHNQTNAGPGGGIYAETAATTNLDGDTVSDNTGQDGGGIYAQGGTMTLDGTTVSGNTAGGAGGGIFIDGQGGETAVSFTMQDGSTVSGNTATGAGGGIEVGGTGNSANDISIDSSTISGNMTGAAGGGIAQDADSTLTVTDSTISGNGPTPEAVIDGGGVFLAGDSNSVDSFSGNTIGGTDEGDPNTAVNGGGVYITGVDPSFAGDTIENNLADGGEGGGVYVGGGSNNTFTNEAINANEAEGLNGSGGSGGGVYIAGGTNSFSLGSVSENTSIDGDDGTGGGGGVFIENGDNSFSGVTIDSNETKDATDGGGVYISGESTNTFASGSISSNQAQANGNGGGLYIGFGTNAFTNETVNSNTAQWTGGENGDGGGFYIDDGTNTITGGSIDGNIAYTGGGAFMNDGTTSISQADISSNTASEGGAGLFLFTEGQPTTVTDSTISHNTVPLLSLGGSPWQGDGGGILAYFCQNVVLTNDTIADNSAPNEGGGYYSLFCGVEAGPLQPAVSAHDQAKPASVSHQSNGTSTALLFDTFDSNSTGDPSGGGNIQIDDASTVTMANTIVANGIVGAAPTTNCAFNTELGASFTSLGYNLVDDSTCGTPGTGDIVGQGAQLGALGNNGGPTNTELPAAGSPAVGAVPEAVCAATGVTTDQRGNARGAGLNGTCTIGAVEVAVTPPTPPPSFNPNGYRMVAADGGIFDFGLNFNGSLALNHLNAPIVGLANSPGVNGYVMVGTDGGVFALGGANFYGSLGGQAIPSPIAAIAAPPAENGYWLVAQNGKIYNYGAVPPLAALSLPPGAHIVGMASTTDGQGAWLTDQLGDVYAEGDAQYEGGLGGVKISAPIVGIAAAANGQGYVLAGADGGVFNYGTQGFFGSVPGALPPGVHLAAPIVGIAVTHSGNGYWMVGSDGGLFNFGDAPFLGSRYTALHPGQPLNAPMVGIQHFGTVSG